MEIILLLAFSLIGFSKSLLLNIDGGKKEYCFYKTLFESDKIKISFLISSDKQERMKTTFKDEKGNLIYSTNETDQSGEYSSTDPLMAAKYTLCFLPQDDSKYFVSFDFFNMLESDLAKKPVSDNEIKGMSFEVNEIRRVFSEIEKNMRFEVDRRTRHGFILSEILVSIKWLTFFKIFVVGGLAVFQTIIIQRFFGKDKRVNTVKGAFKDGL